MNNDQNPLITVFWVAILFLVLSYGIEMAKFQVEWINSLADLIQAGVYGLFFLVTKLVELVLKLGVALVMWIGDWFLGQSDWLPDLPIEDFRF